MARVISGALLLVGVAAVLWLFPPIYPLGVALVVVMLAFREYADIAGRAGIKISRPAAGMACAVVCIAAAIPGFPLEAAFAGTTSGLATVTLILAMTARSDSDNHLGSALQTAAVSAFAPLYIGLPLGLLTATRWNFGREAALLAILTVAISDTFQYYGGRAFGRHLLAPAVSPKKTIEGAVSGFVGAMLSVAVIGHWWLPQMGPVMRLQLGFAAAAAGIVGDLFESLLKRSVGMKDASAVIPGHGGVLDRIDALLFAAPVFYVILKYSF